MHDTFYWESFHIFVFKVNNVELASDGSTWARVQRPCPTEKWPVEREGGYKWQLQFSIAYINKQQNSETDIKNIFHLT